MFSAIMPKIIDLKLYLISIMFSTVISKITKFLVTDNNRYVSNNNAQIHYVLLLYLIPVLIVCSTQMPKIITFSSYIFSIDYVSYSNAQTVMFSIYIQYT